VLRVAKVSAEDIRLNMKLYKACATDWKKFCKDVEPGHMRVQVRAGGGGDTGGMVFVACLQPGVHEGRGVQVRGCNTGGMCLFSTESNAMQRGAIAQLPGCLPQHDDMHSCNMQPPHATSRTPKPPRAC